MSLKQELGEVRDDRPGHRFQEQHQRRHEGDSSPAKRMGMLALGFVVLAAGIFFMPAPGPGILIVAIGGAILARESIRAARVLDWIEVRARAILGWGGRVWQQASMPLRVLLVLLALALTAAAAFFAWRLLF